MAMLNNQMVYTPVLEAKQMTSAGLIVGYDP